MPVNRKIGLTVLLALLYVLAACDGAVQDEAIQVVATNTQPGRNWVFGVPSNEEPLAGVCVSFTLERIPPNMAGIQENKVCPGEGDENLVVGYAPGNGGDVFLFGYSSETEAAITATPDVFILESIESPLPVSGTFFVSTGDVGDTTLPDSVVVEVRTASGSLVSSSVILLNG